jgi:hypothetical protein
MIKNEERRTVRQGAVEVKWSRYLINYKNLEDFHAESTCI